MSQKDHLKQNIHDLVNGYIKKYRYSLFIPICIINSIILHVSAIQQLTLFNYGYLGGGYSEMWESIHENFQRVTSILSGVTFNFNIFHKIRINIGSVLHIDLYPKEAEYEIYDKFDENNKENKQSIKTTLGDRWKYNQKEITLLVLMSQETICTCYNREGNQFTIYLLNDNELITSIFNYYSEMWSNYPLPLKLNNDITGCIVIDLEKGFDFEMNEDVTIDYLHGEGEETINCCNDNSLIPISDCAQGWVCCFNAFEELYY